MAKSKEEKWEIFYSSYPRKVGKKNAKSAFLKLKHKEIDTILDCLPRHLKSWDKKAKEFIPYPSTWLNGRRWEDELEQKGEKFHYKQSQTKICKNQDKQTSFNFKELIGNFLRKEKKHLT